MYDLVMSLVFIIAILPVLYLVLRDPVYLFKSFLRGFRTHSNVFTRQILSPTWLPLDNFKYLNFDKFDQEVYRLKFYDLN